MDLLEIERTGLNLPFISHGKLLIIKGLTDINFLCLEARPPFLDKKTGKDYKTVHGINPNYVIVSFREGVMHTEIVEKFTDVMAKKELLLPPSGAGFDPLPEWKMELPEEIRECCRPLGYVAGEKQ